MENAIEAIEVLECLPIIFKSGVPFRSVSCKQVLVLDCSGEEDQKKPQIQQFLNKENALCAVVGWKAQSLIQLFSVNKEGIYVRVYYHFMPLWNRENELASMKEFHSPSAGRTSLCSWFCTDRASLEVRIQGVTM
nr:DEAD-box ATP-dependent RNA helicase 50 [Ipomoea batatas]